MKQITKRSIALLSLGMLLFLVVVLVIPFAKTGVYFIALIGSLLSFALTLAGYYTAVVKGNTLSRLLGWDIFKAALVLWLVQMAVTVVLMIAGKWIPAWVAALVEILYIGVTIGLMLSKDIAREAVLHTEVADQPDTAAMKSMRAKAASLAATCDLPEMQKLADALRFADPVSCAETAELEQQMQEIIDEIDAQCDTDIIAKQVKELHILLLKRDHIKRHR